MPDHQVTRKMEELDALMQRLKAPNVVRWG